MQAGIPYPSRRTTRHPNAPSNVIGSFSAAILVTLACLVTGCGDSTGGPDVRHAVGDRGNMQFWIAGVCGFDPTCPPERGYPLNADEIGFEPLVGARHNSYEDPRTPLPALYYTSSRDDVFTIRAMYCIDCVHPPECVERKECYTDPILTNVIILDLHAEGRADLIARHVDDDSLFDRISVRVRPPQ
jgi:hypothetical protein